MTNMKQLRKSLRPFLAKGVTIEATNLDAGQALTLRFGGKQVVFNPIGDDHTYLDVHFIGNTK